MAKAPIQRWKVRDNRIFSLLRRQLRRKPASPNSILAESGVQLLAENGAVLRTEQ